MNSPSDVGHTTTPKHPAQSNVASERRHWRMEVGAIPPAALRGNSRAHWAAKRRASDAPSPRDRRPLQSHGENEPLRFRSR